MLVEEHEGKCLSQEYVNNHTKLVWECGRGHQSEAVPYHVKSYGSWCPECAGVRKLMQPEITHYLIRATQELAEILDIALDEHSFQLSRRTDHKIPTCEIA